MLEFPLERHSYELTGVLRCNSAQCDLLWSTQLYKYVAISKRNVHDMHEAKEDVPNK